MDNRKCRGGGGLNSQENFCVQLHKNGLDKGKSPNQEHENLNKNFSQITSKNNNKNDKNNNISDYKNTYSKNEYNTTLHQVQNKLDNKTSFPNSQNTLNISFPQKIIAIVVSLVLVLSLLGGGTYFLLNQISNSKATTETNYIMTTNLFNTDGTINGAAAKTLLTAVGYFKYSATTTAYTAHNIAGRTTNNSGATIIFPMGYVNGTSGDSLYWQATYLYNNYLTIWLNKAYTTSVWAENQSAATYDSYAASNIQNYVNNTFYSLITQSNSILQSIFATPKTAGYQLLNSGTTSDTSYYFYTMSMSYASLFSSGNKQEYEFTTEYIGNDVLTGAVKIPLYSQFDNISTTVGNHYIWLPSFGEICNNTENEYTNNDTSYIGQWGLNKIDRACDNLSYDGTTIDKNWLRSGVKGWASNQALAVNASSGGSNEDGLTAVYGVRPACHISLAALNSAPKGYKVTLNQQSGTGGTSSVSVATGSAMPTITIPTRTGYTFGGYFTGTNGTGTQYYTATGTSVRNWNLSNDTTLYAYWTVNKHTISFISNNPDYGTIYNSGGAIEEGATYTSIAVSQPNCAFLYWIDSSAPNTPIYQNPLTITVTADKTYTAYFTNSLAQGITVTSTIGGSAEILGDDFSNLADTDTVTLVARLKLNGYKFDGWFVQGETTAFSTAESVRAQYSTIKDKVIVARFSKISANINDDTNNTDEIL